MTQQERYLLKKHLRKDGYSEKHINQIITNNWEKYFPDDFVNRKKFSLPEVSPVTASGEEISKEIPRPKNAPAPCIIKGTRICAKSGLYLGKIIGGVVITTQRNLRRVRATCLAKGLTNYKIVDSMDDYRTDDRRN